MQKPKRTTVPRLMKGCESSRVERNLARGFLDLYPTPSCRVKKGKGGEIEVKNIRRLEKRGCDVRLKNP